MSIYHDQAILHSATCFLNSLLREWNDYQVIQKNQQSHIEIKLDDESVLTIPLKQYSSLGRHVYTGEFFVHGISLSFEQMVYRLCTKLAKQFDTPLEQVNKFKERVFASLQNIETSLEIRENFIESVFKSGLSFKDAEQGLFIGHNFHPTPKSRDQFDLADMKTYSPEFGGHFALDWYMADPSILIQNQSTSFKVDSWTSELAEQEIGDQPEYQKLKVQGFVALPMHPWQMKALSENANIQKYIQSGLLVQLIPSKMLWYPTSSLRSIYRQDAPYMLKFSMSVKLTNSIRHMLTHEVERGLQLRDVLSTELGQVFLKDHPQFKVVTEPAYFSLKNEKGEAMDETIVVCRDNPFQSVQADHKSVLATLTQDAPLSGMNLIQSMIKSAADNLSFEARSVKWFKEYLNCVVTPLVQAQSNYGIILGAHQQNLIIDFKQGYPVAAYFRDCQGTGYSELGFHNFSKHVPSIYRENGNVVSEKMGNYLFAYYLILNSTFNVITAIAQSGWVSELILIQILKDHLQTILDQKVKDPSCLNYILNGAELMHKGNFICAFKNINENTTVDPLVIYTGVQNPFPGEFHA